MASTTLRRALNLEYIEVPLDGMCDDGKPPAVRCRQPSWQEWQASRGGVPLASTVTEDGSNRELTQQEAEEWSRWSREIVMLSVVEARIPVRDDATGEWSEIWEPCQIVPVRTTNPNQIWIDDFDTRRGSRTNVVRVWTALISDLRHGGAFAQTKAATFHGAANVDAVDARDQTGMDAARMDPATT